MSDKAITGQDGQTFEVRRGPNEIWSVKKGSDAPTEHQVFFNASRIDHQTQRLLTCEAGNRRLIWVYARGSKRILSWPGGSIELEAAEAGETGGAGGGKLRPLKLTMPGKVVAVKVKEGDVVTEGSGLVVVEAMKMENLLLAPARAKIAKVHVSVGDRLESGAVLITFESPQ